jgi:hypothetical protein
MNIWELQPKTPQFYYYNEEWNDPRDEDHEDFVDTYIEPKEDTTYYDDYEEYGH